MSVELTQWQSIHNKNYETNNPKILVIHHLHSSVFEIETINKITRQFDFDMDNNKYLHVLLKYQYIVHLDY